MYEEMTEITKLPSILGDYLDDHNMVLPEMKLVFFTEGVTRPRDFRSPLHICSFFVSFRSFGLAPLVVRAHVPCRFVTLHSCGAHLSHLQSAESTAWECPLGGSGWQWKAIPDKTGSLHLPVRSLPDRHAQGWLHRQALDEGPLLFSLRSSPSGLASHDVAVSPHIMT